MSEILIDTDAPILVEFEPAAGLRKAARTPEEAVQEAARALNRAMGLIHHMARRVARTVSAVPVAERPHQAEVTFGLKLDAEAGAVIAKAGMEASINVKLTWEREKAPAQPAQAEG